MLDKESLDLKVLAFSKYIVQIQNKPLTAVKTNSSTRVVVGKKTVIVSQMQETN